MRLRLPLKKDGKRNNSLVIWLLVLCLFCCSCQPSNYTLEPVVCYSPPPCLIESLPSPFAPLSMVEHSQDWGKEYFIGKRFAKEMDLYRALTCFKRALFLIPHNHERRLEIEYEIFFAYYTANKYQEAVEAFERSRLLDVTKSFPLLDLLIALYDSYIKVNLPERAGRVLILIETMEASTANNLILETAIIDADFPGIVNAAACSPSNESIAEFLSIYFSESKSISKAKILNAILPGAGYYYVGQKKSAVTSFLINALFIAAAYQLFDRGYIAGGIIVTSLEMGWYFGGINGAGLEAKQYNDVLYSRLARKTLEKERLFPILMIQKGF